MASMNEIILVLLIFRPCFANSDTGDDWSYHGDKGPDHWSKWFKACGGNQQSPIDIITSDAIYDPFLGKFDLHNYDTVANVTLSMKNNGHTVQIDLDNEDLSVTSAGLNKTYHAAQFHFHWGSGDQKGSEHDINGHFFPMEMHIVHFSDDYPSITEAMEQEGGLTVLGFLFEVGDHNDHFDVIINHFSNITHQDETTSIPSFPLRSLMPENLDVFYRYYGSLTTPPCYEFVNWSVFKDTVKISEDQLEAFRNKIYHELKGKEVPVSDDYRPSQALNGRRVFTNDLSGIYNDGTFVQPFQSLAFISGIGVILYVYSHGSL